jgi:hypothetical protein
VRAQQQKDQAVELDPSQRVAFFRDTFAPMARSIPFGARFVRLFDGVDISDPEAAAEGRDVFELHAVT